MKNIMAESCNSLVMQKGIQASTTNSIDEEPVFGDGFGIKEEFCTNVGLRQVVIRQIRNVTEQREASTRFEHEKGDSLLNEQPDKDSGPLQFQMTGYVKTTTHTSI